MATPLHQIRFSVIPKLLLGCALLLIGCDLISQRTWGQDAPDISQTLNVRSHAEQLIPWNNLTEPAKVKLRSVISDTTVFQRLHVQQVQCDPNVYIHLIRHPEILTNIWQLMGVSRLRIDRTDKFRMYLDDGQGTKTKLELIYGTPNLHLFYCEGSYTGSLIPTKSTGRAIILIRSRYTNQERMPTVKHQMDLFLQIDDVADKLIVKTLSYFFTRTADTNFAETTQFLGQIDNIVRSNPTGMVRLANRLTRVETPIRKQFGILVENASTQYIRVAKSEKPYIASTQK